MRLDVGEEKSTAPQSLRPPLSCFLFSLKHRLALVSLSVA